MATHLRIRTDDDARRAGHVFVERAKCQGVLITRGEHGMSLVDPSGEAHYPAVAREVADVTGAGDTVIATLALGLAAGASLAEAAQLANQAAGIVVRPVRPGHGHARRTARRIRVDRTPGCMTRARAGTGRARRS